MLKGVAMPNEIQNKVFSRTESGELEISGFMPVKAVFSREQITAMIRDMKTRISEFESMLSELDRLDAEHEKSKSENDVHKE